MRSFSRTYTLVLSLAFVGCTPDGEETKVAKPAPKPAYVAGAVVSGGQLTTQVEYLGAARAALTTPLSAGIAGTITRISVREGDRVKKGESLVELDARGIRADLESRQALEERTKAQLAQAERQLARIDQSKSALSSPERERFELDVAVLSAQKANEAAALERLRVDLAHHRITAPFDGVVMKRHGNPGAWVQVGEPILEILSSGEMEVIVDVPFAVGREMVSGQEALFRAAGESAPAVVVGVVPALDVSTRSMRLRLRAAGDKQPEWLISGLPVQVRLTRTLTREKGVVVPRDAVVLGPAASRVVKIEDGTGLAVPVTVVGATADEVLVVGEGLAPGDTVMTRGNERYRPGTPVVMESATGRAPLRKK